MPHLIPLLIRNTAERLGERLALAYGEATLDYATLWQSVETAARGFLELDIGPRDRIAVYLPKQIETIVALFGASHAGAAFVPVNPALKARQVGHILRDCNVRMLVTSADRLASLADEVGQCHDLRNIVIVGDPPSPGVNTVSWQQVMELGAASARTGHRAIDSDMAAILYTSGSTGLPKGVVLSHRNMVAGAKSVASYLNNTPEDRLLAVLPLSFDYGFSQLTTGFLVGASVRLMNYLLPRDIPRAVARHRITGLACVPPLWIQLAELDWPAEAQASLRYITSTGGRMPDPLVKKLKSLLPTSEIYLMYGLTEAFRSTFLPPDEIDARPNSIGKAVPNAEILVVRPDGRPCGVNEPGELVHRGVLVGMGYWNDPKRTAERYKTAPGQDPALPIQEMAVWSGDTVKMDEDGYLYFVGRRDEMIKTSGFRVSPVEVEEIIYASGKVGEVAAIGVDHPALGQAIIVVVTAPEGAALDKDTVLAHCRKEMPSYMVPAEIVEWQSLPRNPNGKVDRKLISSELGNPLKDAAE